MGGRAGRHPPAEHQMRAVLLPTGEPVPGHCLLLGKKKGEKNPNKSILFT